MFYIVGSEVSAREDRQTEFKGHKNVSSKDIPPWLTQSSKRRTQSPISRAICGFLNTGEGGIVYIGWKATYGKLVSSQLYLVPQPQRLNWRNIGNWNQEPLRH